MDVLATMGVIGLPGPALPAALERITPGPSPGVSQWREAAATSSGCLGRRLELAILIPGSHNLRVCPLRLFFCFPAPSPQSSSSHVEGKQEGIHL